MACYSVESICGTLRCTHCRLNRFGTSKYGHALNRKCAKLRSCSHAGFAGKRAERVMVVRTLGLIAVLLLIALTAWAVTSSRRREREQDALSQQARALRAAGWREDRRTGRWSHPTKTNGELLLSEAEMVEATGTDWPEELRR
jgi:hypothetical protein